ncbi:MAG: hypothetical protein ACJ71W_21965 [Terriglobales bacterium]
MDAVTIISAIGGAVISGALTVLGNALITARSQGKTEGVIRTEITGLKDRTTKIEDEQKEQWSKIGEHAQDIGYLKGRVGRANGAAAGHGS